MSNRASMRRTASRAIGEITAVVLPWTLRRAFAAMSARAKNGRLAWAQHPAATIGRFAVRVVQFVIAAEGVGLEDPGIVGEMCLRVLAAAIARVIKHRRRRTLSAKRPIVADIGP